MRERAAALAGCRAFALPGCSAACGAAGVASSLLLALPPPTSPQLGPSGSPAPVTPGAFVVLWFLSNVARNSPACISKVDVRSLELQRFEALLKVQAIELRATFAGV